MKALKVFGILVGTLFLWQCGTQNDIATNYYADGIYYDPSYGELLANVEEKNQPATDDDYYDPNYNSSANSNSNNNLNNNYSSNIRFNVGYSTMFSPWGYGSMMSMSYGNPYMMGMYDYGYGYGYGYNPYSFYNPYYGGYPGYGYGYNPYYPVYGGGWGYNPYNPYYPSYGYPNYGGGGYYPDNNYNARIKTPDVVIRGGSTPRGNRSSTGSVNSSGTPRTQSGKQAGETTLRQHQISQNQEASNTQPKSRIRQASDARGATYQRGQMPTTAEHAPSRSVTPVSRQSEDLMYQKASRSTVPTRATRTNTSNTNTNHVRTPNSGTTTINRGNTATPPRQSTLERQTETVIKRSPSNSGNYNTRTQSAPTRTHTPNSSGQNRSYTPPASNSGGGVRSSAPATRSSSGGGGGGEIRTNSGTRR